MLSPSFEQEMIWTNYYYQDKNLYDLLKEIMGGSLNFCSLLILIFGIVAFVLSIFLWAMAIDYVTQTLTKDLDYALVIRSIIFTLGFVIPCVISIFCIFYYLLRVEPENTPE